jgi:hypothetical protein
MMAGAAPAKVDNRGSRLTRRAALDAVPRPGEVAEWLKALAC